MQFSKVLLAAAAFAVTQVAAVIFTNPSFGGITAGSAFNITWSDATGPVTLTLKNGDPGALKTVNTIASGLSGGSFIWIPSASLASGLYALQIDDSTGTPNYSVQFTLSGGVASASSAAASSLSSLVSSASSALSSITSNSTSSAFSAATSSSTTASTTKSTSSKTSSSSAGTASATTAPSSAAGLSSPIALIFLAFAAFLTLN